MSQLFGGYYQHLPESAGSGASPGFSFGRSGNITNGYLDNESVPSNTTGRFIGLANARMIGVNVNNENANTFSVVIEERIGSTFTVIGTFDVVSARGQSFVGLSVNLTTGSEMACRISSGSCKNPVVTVFVKGDAL